AYEGTWSGTPAGERARLLNKIADLLEANAAELGRLETLDMGMPILMTGAMGAVAAEVFRYWAGMATKLHGLTSPALRPGDFLGYTLREPGAALASHPGVDKIAFTGEYVTGRLIVQMSATNLKTVTLELGGKSPHIIFDDADLDTAVANALFGIYMNTGQICSAGTRILVQD